MEAFVLPFTVASVFTIGGYAIVQAKRHAEIISFVLGVVVLLAAVTVLSVFVAQLASGRCARWSDMCFAPVEPQDLAWMPVD